MFDKHAFTAPAPDMSKDEFYQMANKAAPYWDAAAFLAGDDVPGFLKKVNPFRAAAFVSKFRKAHDYKNCSKRFGRDVTLHAGHEPDEMKRHGAEEIRHTHEPEMARRTHDTEYQAIHVH